MKSKYFKIEELVCRHVYEKFGDKAWMFIDSRLVETLNLLREKILGVPMIINTWKDGGGYSQRGLRCNRCQLVREKTAPYLSAHVLGKGVDFNATGMTSDQVRSAIIKAQVLLPYPVRLERDVSWVHLDVYDSGNGNKVTLFTA